jgi:large conductance mechanosensitive channel
MNGQHYATIEEAKKAGVGTLNYGLFLNAVINFLIIAFIVFLIVKGANSIRKKPAEVAAAPATPPPPTTDQQLLMEIRDALRAGRA